MVWTVGMTNTTTHPEDRPWTFELPEGRDWLEPGDTDYAWVLDDLREHEVIGYLLDRIVPHAQHGEEPADVTLPVIAYGRRGRIEMTWPNLAVVFSPTWTRRSYRTYSIDVSPFDIDPDGRFMVTAAAFK